METLVALFCLIAASALATGAGIRVAGDPLAENGSQAVVGSVVFVGAAAGAVVATTMGVVAAGACQLGGLWPPRVAASVLPSWAPWAPGTIAWLGVTHAMYAVFDINAGRMAKRLGKPFYFYQRYSELVLHWLIAIRFARGDHALQAIWHLWEYIDVTAGGRVAESPDLAHALDWLDAASWVYSAFQINGAAAPGTIAGAAVVYTLVLRAVWGAGLKGNDAQGRISYGASLVTKKDKKG